MFIRAPDFNLDLTVFSGQPPQFTMDYGPGWASFVYENSLVTVKQKAGEDELEIEAKGKKIDEGKLSEHVSLLFRLDDDMPYIRKRIGTDAHMKKLLVEFPGMRLTLNDPWETLACFVCSQNNSRRNIRNSVQLLMRNFGEKIKIAGRDYNKFPTPERITAGCCKDLKKCKIGFRAEYLMNAAEFAQGGAMAELHAMSYEEAHSVLTEIKGVGEKIADCVLLFGYGRLEAFPIDTWIRKVMREYYLGSHAKDDEIRMFAEGRWGDYAGYAQQYLYRSIMK
ncbi:MAG: hypothetical protein NT157_00030 [Candidatus Micrarchaeota archaeon]|nr:hypothetical protein [Candidatus Micrarchaeota archaeon]